MNATAEEIEKAFTEWMRRYQANTEEFTKAEESFAKAPETYGQAVTPYFLQILSEIKAK
jgi:hypothetical protein